MGYFMQVGNLSILITKQLADSREMIYHHNLHYLIIATIPPKITVIITPELLILRLE